MSTFRPRGPAGPATFARVFCSRSPWAGSSGPAVAICHSTRRPGPKASSPRTGCGPSPSRRGSGSSATACPSAFWTGSLSASCASSGLAAPSTILGRRAPPRSASVALPWATPSALGASRRWRLLPVGGARRAPFGPDAAPVGGLLFSCLPGRWPRPPGLCAPGPSAPGRRRPEHVGRGSLACGRGSGHSGRRPIPASPAEGRRGSRASASRPSLAPRPAEVGRLPASPPSAGRGRRAPLGGGRRPCLARLRVGAGLGRRRPSAAPRQEDPGEAGPRRLTRVLRAPPRSPSGGRGGASSAMA